METVQTIRDVLELVGAGFALVAATIHVLGFDDAPWAKRILAVSIDIIGALKVKKGGPNAS